MMAGNIDQSEHSLFSIYQSEQILFFIDHCRLVAVTLNLMDWTLKMFLRLYGHKLPVTSLGISDDSALIVTVHSVR